MSDLIDRQPEKRTNERTETHACDCISRKAAIDELDKGAWGVEWDKTLAKTMIESLPSAQPERKTGRWNPDPINGVKPYGYVCNLCGAWQPVERNYCPDCGADMREAPND